MSYTVQKSSEIFKALGDSNRLKILQILTQSTHPVCVGKMACILKITQPAVSQQLKVLKNAGLLQSNKVGNLVHYSVNTNGLNGLNMDLNSILESMEKIDLEKDKCGKDQSGECHKKD